MTFEPTSTRIWKRLSPAERLAAANYFWNEPPQAAVAAGLATLVKARKLRPQAARALPPEQQARILATVLDPGESVAAFLLVALHLGGRRPLLRRFLDELGLAHEDGVLKEDATQAVEEGKIESAVRRVAGEFPRGEIEVYLNTLWLQDPDRWSVLQRSADWLGPAS